jgi:predicted dehydrogenase
MIRIGIVGASSDRGWGALAHIPALGALPGFELAAVATRSVETATAAARAFDIPLAFGSAQEMLASADIDAVAIAVRTPEHDAIVHAAAQAGKHVFCEWPLSPTCEQAESAYRAVDEAGVCHMVGLQGYQSPGARYVRRLVDAGAIGKLVSLSLVARGGPSGSVIPAANVYAADARSGASVLSITTGHALSVVDVVAGWPTELVGLVTVANRSRRVLETDAIVEATSPDQVVLSGTLDGGAALSVAVQGGSIPACDGFELTLVGTQGLIAVRPASPRNIQIADWAVSLTDERGGATRLDLPADLVPAGLPASPARNTALMYAEFGAAITAGRKAWPDLGVAVQYHRLLDLVERSSRLGTRERLAFRPDAYA